MADPSKSRRYKETTFQQLRSFYETARLGSLSAAADSLELSHPTVWAQVHALEREFGEPLIEPHGRGCRLTIAGEVMAKLAAPIVLGAASLRQHFLEERSNHRPKLIVVATPRVLTDDLPECIAKFSKLRPDVDLVLRELAQTDAVAQVSNGDADIGVVGQTSSIEEEHSPWIEQHPAYDVSFVLIAPKNHPLARKRHIVPEDIAEYPLLNGPTAFTEQDLLARLQSMGAFRDTPCRVEAQFTATSKTFVQLGYGIALIAKRPGQAPDSRFFEYDMSKYFGLAPICVILRKGQLVQDTTREFQKLVKELLGTTTSKRSRTKKTT